MCVPYGATLAFQRVFIGGPKRSWRRSASVGELFGWLGAVGCLRRRLSSFLFQVCLGFDFAPVVRFVLRLEPNGRRGVWTRDAV